MDNAETDQGKNKMRYKVANHLFEVVLPSEANAELLLPSFTPFISKDETGPLLFLFDSTSYFSQEGGVPIEESENDMGHITIWKIEQGYRIEARHILANKRHTMVADKEFRTIRATIQWDDEYASQILCSMLRIAFSQALLREDGIGIHASAVGHNGKCFLFLGKSGTGKSTHASLWLQHVEKSELINDDNPAIRIQDDIAYAYGTPWSGKTPCYKNIGLPIAKITRLQQAPTNNHRHLSDTEAFIALLPSCSVIKQDTQLYGMLCDKLAWLAEHTNIAYLQCLPDKEAVILNKETF